MHIYTYTHTHTHTYYTNIRNITLTHTYIYTKYIIYAYVLTWQWQYMFMYIVWRCHCCWDHMFESSVYGCNCYYCHTQGLLFFNMLLSDNQQCCVLLSYPIDCTVGIHSPEEHLPYCTSQDKLLCTIGAVLLSTQMAHVRTPHCFEWQSYMDRNQGNLSRIYTSWVSVSKV